MAGFGDLDEKLVTVKLTLGRRLANARRLAAGTVVATYTIEIPASSKVSVTDLESKAAKITADSFTTALKAAASGESLNLGTIAVSPIEKPKTATGQPAMTTKPMVVAATTGGVAATTGGVAATTGSTTSRPSGNETSSAVVTAASVATICVATFLTF